MPGVSWISCDCPLCRDPTRAWEFVTMLKTILEIFDGPFIPTAGGAQS